LIRLNNISKSFKVAKRAAGLGSAFKSLFRRSYTYVQALQDISFTIEPGEIVGYIGPNGAGKSTTIKIMSGILVPDEGSCTIMGYTPWKNRLEYVKRIGVVFGQRSQLWWDVPVIDSFELLRDIYNIPQRAYRDNVDLLTQTLDLGGILHTPVRQLSLGQRMRCEIAASLLHGPDILFLDEPTIGLDAVSKIAVRDFIRTIRREKGVTVILTTHDMHDIEALADRIIMIGRGRILLDGKLEEIRSRFGGRKTVRVDFRTAGGMPPKPDVPGVEAGEISHEHMVLHVDTHQCNIADVISRLSSEAELLDVTVESQPIEQIIVDLYKEYDL
jgi:ABC-2 type transport system ATP-binding protein